MVSHSCSECTVVDMGCGEALLAASVPHDVSSFDLKALNDRVTVADMSKVPMQVCILLVLEKLCSTARSAIYLSLTLNGL